jgi:hypothetical protein
VKKLLFAIVLGLCVPLLCLAGTGSSPAALEKELLEALKVNGNAGPEKVINDYAAEQLIDRWRTERSDFEDYYVLRKPALLLGHDLLVIR